MRQLALFKEIVKSSDVVYTPVGIAKSIINFLNPQGLCLDPCKGDGAFYDNLPDNKMYCEVKDGLDFFDFNTSVEWIIGNPPYSMFKEFLEHSFKLSNNVSYLIPTNKLFQRQIIMDLVNEWGGVKSIIVYGSGTLIGFPFGFSVGNFHFQKGYKNETKLIIGMKSCPK